MPFNASAYLMFLSENINPHIFLLNMLNFSEKAQSAIIRCADFVDTMNSAKIGDVVYCDRPYIPLSKTSSFTSYSSGGFNLEQQHKLAQLAQALSKKGIPGSISNHNTEFIIKAYAKAKIITFDVQRYISCKGENRRKESASISPI